MKLLISLLLLSAGFSLSSLMIVHAQEGSNTLVQPACDESNDDIKNLIFDVWGRDGIDGVEWNENPDYYCGSSRGSSSINGVVTKSETISCFYEIPNYYYASVEYVAGGYDDVIFLEPESLTVTTTYYIYGTDTISSSGQIIIGFTGGSDCFNSFEAPVYFDEIKYLIENLDDIELPSSDYPSFSPPQSDFPSSNIPHTPTSQATNDDCNMHNEIVDLLDSEFSLENCIAASSISDEGGEYTHNCKMEVTDTIGVKNVTAKYTAINSFDENGQIVVTPYTLTVGDEGDDIVGIQPVIEFTNDCTGDDLSNAQYLLKDVLSSPPQDDCNMHNAIVDLLDNEFGLENCIAASSISDEGGEYTHNCKIEVTDTIGAKNVTAKYTAINSFDENDQIVVTPYTLTVGDEGDDIVGIQPVIEFTNDCTGDDLSNAQDLLKDILSSLPQNCDQSFEILDLMDDKFGPENCIGGELPTSTEIFNYDCSIEDFTGTGTITAKFVSTYGDGDVTSQALSLTLGYGGDLIGIEPVIEFTNYCTGDDLRNAELLLIDVVVNNNNPNDKDECTQQDEVITGLLMDAFGDENCAPSSDQVDSTTYTTWRCTQLIEHTHAFKGIVDEVWVAIYKNKILEYDDNHDSMIPYNLTLNSLVVFEEGDLSNDENSNSYTIDSIGFVNNCTTIDNINKAKDLLKWVTAENEEIIDNDDDSWSDYFYCVWAHWFDKEKCSTSWEDWFGW